MKEYANLTKKILDNGMDYVVEWKSEENEGLKAQVKLVDENGNEIKKSIGESFEKCMDEIGAYFLQ